jgi:Cytochrome c oxidase biogenesis protein Cmc1 like
MQIDSLRECQETRPMFIVWACNELKYRMDQCFKEEKERMLKELNKDIVSSRAGEEAQAAMSTGTNMTFEQYLKKDKAYQREMENIQQAKNTGSWFGY